MLSVTREQLHWILPAFGSRSYCDKAAVVLLVQLDCAAHLSTQVENQITEKSAGPSLWNNCISCSCICTLVMIWSSFLGFMWAFERDYRAPLVLCLGLLAFSSCSLFPLAQLCCSYCPPVQFLWTDNTLIPGTRVLSLSLTLWMFPYSSKSHFRSFIHHYTQITPCSAVYYYWIYK